MYPFLLTTHSLMRWVVLIAGIYLIVRAVRGVVGKRPYVAGDSAAGLFFTISLDIQLVIGLLLYGVFSPVTRTAFANMADAMGTREIRFFVAEHFVLMMLAVAVAHVTSVLVRRAPVDDVKFKRAAIGGLVTLALILAGIPWWRPALPALGG